MLDVNPLYLTETIARALEDMAFISPLPWEGPAPALSANPVIASVRCHGALNGFVEVLTNSGFGEAVVANMLGVSPDHDDAILGSDDALREVMNITAGLIMRGLGDGAPGSLALDMPTVDHRVEPAAWSSFLADPNAALLEAEGHPLAIRVRSAA